MTFWKTVARESFLQRWFQGRGIRKGSNMREEDAIKDYIETLKKDYAFTQEQIEKCKEEMKSQNIVMTTNNGKTHMINPAMKSLDLLIKQKILIAKELKEFNFIVNPEENQNNDPDLMGFVEGD